MEKEKILNEMAYELREGTHTFTMCKCGRTGCRSGKCIYCLAEDLLEIKEKDFDKILYMKFGEINLSGATSQFKKKVKKYKFKKNDAVILHISIPKDNIVRLVNVEPITQKGIRQVIKEAEEYAP